MRQFNPDMKEEEKEDMAVSNVNLTDVEICHKGIFNGNIEITEKTIDDMIANFDSKVAEPPIKITHDSKVNEAMKAVFQSMGFGFVSKLKKSGDALLADFKQVPLKVADCIKSGLLKQRSIEFYKKYLVNGKVLENVLTAVSYFGNALPAVNGMAEEIGITLTNTTNDGERIIINLEEKEITLENKPDVIQLSRDEYDKLISLQTEVTEASAKIIELSKEVDRRADYDKLVVFQAEVAKKELERVREDGVKVIEKAIVEARILPKFKDAYVDDYMMKAQDATKLAIFLEDINSRKPVVELGAGIEPPASIDADDVSKLSNDQLNEKIEVLTKSGKTMAEAYLIVTGKKF